MLMVRVLQATTSSSKCLKESNNQSSSQEFGEEGKREWKYHSFAMILLLSVCGLGMAWAHLGLSELWELLLLFLLSVLWLLQNIMIIDYFLVTQEKRSYPENTFKPDAISTTLVFFSDYVSSHKFLQATEKFENQNLLKLLPSNNLPKLLMTATEILIYPPSFCLLKYLGWVSICFYHCILLVLWWKHTCTLEGFNFLISRTIQYLIFLMFILHSVMKWIYSNFSIQMCK